MPNYIFLDNWVLTDYTRNDKRQLLSDLIRKNNYTIVVNSLSLVEMFNPGWRGATGEDRTVRAARFLSQHPTVIIYPHKVYAAEIEAYPGRLTELPVELELDSMAAPLREETLLSFLRGDDIFVRQGKDIQPWVEGYRKLKADWLQDVKDIIDHACHNGALKRDANGNLVELDIHKEKFLQSLDRRHFTPEQIQRLGRPVIQLFMSDTIKLPAIRLSSLCFWYAYVDEDKAYPMKKSSSDIGDFYQISLIPYCSAFTVDKAIYRLVTRVLTEVNSVCEIFSPSSLEIKLANTQ